MARARAYIGLGGNVGAAQATLTAAAQVLGALPGSTRRGVSNLYVTRPFGDVAQADFLNAVVAVDVPVGPDPEAGALALLMVLKGIEEALGRQRREHWGPRELDLDLLLFGRHRINVERPRAARSKNPAKGADALWLTVPHPEMRERLFVLAPLSDLARWLSPPGWHETVDTACVRQQGIEGAHAVERVGIWHDHEWLPIDD